MKLHLGCGKRNFGPDWVHIDGGDFSHLHSHDITKLPFENNSVDLIYSSHVLEYFDREEEHLSLKKVLQSNGFRGIQEYDWRNTEHSHIDDHSQSYLPHMDKENGTLMSLNIECYKIG